MHDTTLGPTDSDALASETRALERRGRLHWVHWLVLLLSLLITVFAWHQSSKAVEERTNHDFEQQADQIVGMFQERLQVYANFLQTTVGFVSGTESISPTEWRRFAAEVNVEKRFPAIISLGIVDEVPSGMMAAFIEDQRKHWPTFPTPELSEEIDVYYQVVQVWPKQIEKRIIGLDVGSDANRLEAVTKALKNGSLQTTPPLLPTGRDSLAFLMFTGFDRSFAEPDVARDAGRAARGVVAATVLVEDLIAGILDKERRLLSITVSDQNEVIYDESGSANRSVDPNPEHVRSQDIEVFGRMWHLEIKDTRAFRKKNASIGPMLIVCGGLLIDVLLLTLFLLLSRSNRQALSYAERAGRRLLEMNKELESFAYIVSHDLKTPIRGIDNLAEFIEEDLAAYRKGGNDGPDIDNHVRRIRRQVAHSNKLISGIQAYSGLDKKPECSARVDAREMLEDIRETLGVRTEQLVLEGEFPVFDTYETRLAQVLANLVGNAFKYHHDVANAQVIVTLERIGEWLRFSVADNGPGIASRFHGTIFDLFETINTDPAIDSTGVGLSIVKKTVDLMGGRVSVRSSPGDGATFTFDWPIHVEEVGRSPFRPNDDVEFLEAA